MAAAEATAKFHVDSNSGAHETKVTINRKATTVTVTLSQYWSPAFAHFVLPGITPVSVTSTARLIGTDNICILALAPNGLSGIHLNLLARVEAQDCGVYSNTRSVAGIRLDIQARLQSKLNCSAGGVLGLLSNMRPSPITDCPQMEDPLAAVPSLSRMVVTTRIRGSAQAPLRSTPASTVAASRSPVMRKCTLHPASTL